MENDKFNKTTKSAFKTHYNYTKCMNKLLQDMFINYKVNESSLLDYEKIDKFSKLAEITKVSINGDVSACKRQVAFAQIAAPWIPVKCYYYIYYLESIFLHLLTGTDMGFKIGGHTRIRNQIKNLINTSTIKLSGKGGREISQIREWKTVNLFTTTSHTIRTDYYLDEQCPNSLRKKISEYVEYDWKQKKGIINYKKKINMMRKNEELFPKTISLLDYFYWMRIKANYRDLDFLDFDRDITEFEAYKYLDTYVSACNFYAASLNTVIRELMNQRK